MTHSRFSVPSASPLWDQIVQQLEKDDHQESGWLRLQGQVGPKWYTKEGVSFLIDFLERNGYDALAAQLRQELGPHAH